MSRVLHVVTSMSVGGIQTYVLTVFRCYHRQRFHMDVCCTGGTPAPTRTRFAPSEAV